MHIVLFSHPLFLKSQSMPRYARMIADNMKQRGHRVEIWSPSAYFSKIPIFNKWFGYIDQYLIFPWVARKRLKTCSIDTLFVFTDNALGPWFPIVSDRKHIIHCHDFLAQQSGLGQIPENTIGWTGRIYQAYIRSGYRKGQNFVSVSKKTQQDLHLFLGRTPAVSDVVYNILTRKFAVNSLQEARTFLTNTIGINVSKGFIFHVGGNQWYKNRKGVIEIYNAWRKMSDMRIPLLMAGFKPTDVLMEFAEKSPYKEDIHWLVSASDDIVNQAYLGASVFLFPSLVEGFGLPILEAMSLGTLVLTTGEEPMKEVGGDAAFYIDRRPLAEEKRSAWAESSAKVLDKIMRLSEEDKNMAVEKGFENIRRFEKEKVLDKLESIYKSIVEA